MELAFRRDNHWRQIMADRSFVFNTSTVVGLSDRGLPVSSVTAREFVRYLGDLEGGNLATLPIAPARSHLGWCGESFWPGAEGNIVLDTDDIGAASIATGYREAGTLEDWKTKVAVARAHPIARFLLAASFAAPLLELVNQRVFIIHSWGPTRGGKTAAAKAALSAWGDPDTLMASFYATRVGLERLAGFYADLPLVIDEKQVSGEKQGYVEGLVYLLGLGKGKTRGAKSGGLQAVPQWRTIIITTGEEPISSEASRAGVKTRAIELYGHPIPDEPAASRLHEETRSCHGGAGRTFIQQVIEQRQRAPDTFVEDQKNVLVELSAKAEQRIYSHLAAVATVVLGDYYSSLWVWKLEPGQALQEALALGTWVVEHLEAAPEQEDAHRAYQHLLSWYAEHAAWFLDDPTTKEKYGFELDGWLYILPTAFSKCMSEGEFSVRRILRDWAEREWAKSEQGRLTTRRYWPRTRRQEMFVTIKMPNRREDEDL